MTFDMKSNGVKTNGVHIPEKVRLIAAAFINNKRSGSITLHFKDGHLKTWELREIGHLT